MPNMNPRNHEEIAQYIALVGEYGKPRTFEKGDLICRCGDAVDHMFFMVSGLVKCFRVHEGKEVIYRLMTDGSMVLGYSGFITGEPSTEDIECLQECSGFWIRIRDLEDLRDSNPAIDRIYRYLAEQHYLTMERRLMMLHHKSAEQRYRFFLQHMSPKIVSETPMNCIASYLGVTSESFSRMKRTLII